MTNKDDSKRKTHSSEHNNTQEGCSYFKTWPILPSWASEREREQWGNRIEIKEWDGPYLNGNDQEVQVYRADQGWKVSCLSTEFMIRIISSISYGNYFETYGHFYIVKGKRPSSFSIGTRPSIGISCKVSLESKFWNWNKTDWNRSLYTEIRIT